MTGVTSPEPPKSGEDGRRRTRLACTNESRARLGFLWRSGAGACAHVVGSVAAVGGAGGPGALHGFLSGRPRCRIRGRLWARVARHLLGALAGTYSLVEPPYSLAIVTVADAVALASSCWSERSSACSANRCTGLGTAPAPSTGGNPIQSRANQGGAARERRAVPRHLRERGRRHRPC